MVADTGTEFKINSRPDDTFRVAYISPVDLLAITTQIDFENFTMTKTLFKFSLENVEIKQGEKWIRIKQPDKEIYWPKDISKDFTALNELSAWMMENVIMEVFMNSNESTEKTQ